MYSCYQPSDKADNSKNFQEGPNHAGLRVLLTHRERETHTHRERDTHTHTHKTMCTTRPKRARSTTANALIRDLGLKVRYVRDDGNCWIYAVLATMGGYTCSSTWPPPDPSRDERSVALQIRHELSATLGTDVCKGPDYDGERPDDDFFGSYGGMEELLALCALLSVQIIVWDRANPEVMRDCDARYECYSPLGIDCLTAADIQRRLLSRAVPTVHVAWSKRADTHFDALVCD